MLPVKKIVVYILCFQYTLQRMHCQGDDTAEIGSILS